MIKAGIIGGAGYTAGEVNKAWTADDVKGFTKILGNQIKIYHNVQKRNKK